MWQVYILYSVIHGRSYVGCTSDLLKRMEYHNGGKVASTKKHRPWKVVYTETTNDRSAALIREKYYKSSAGRRKMKVIFAELGINTR